MTCSPERLAANRANSVRSTGPRTAEGKAISRANSYKHGLSGAGVVIPEAELADVHARVAEFHDDLKPKGPRACFLAMRAALLSLRMEKCIAHEMSASAYRVGKALNDFDEIRNAEADELIGKIGMAPYIHRRKLMQTPEGVDRLIAAFQGLRQDLDMGRWTFQEGLTAVWMSGHRSTDPPMPRFETLTNAIIGKFDRLTPAEGGWLDGEDRKEWGRHEIGKEIDAEIERLREHRATIDLEAIERDRAGAPARAWFDPSKEATLARKYEAATDRAFFRSLKEIDEIKKAQLVEVAAVPTGPAPAANPDNGWASGSLASFFRGDRTEAAKADATDHPDSDESPDRPIEGVESVPTALVTARRKPD